MVIGVMGRKGEWVKMKWEIRKYMEEKVKVEV